MRTGFAMTEEPEDPEDVVLLMMAFVVHVAEKATERAILYAEHKGFQKARASDMVKSMKYTAMSILNHQNFIERLIEITQEIKDNVSDSEEEFETDSEEETDSEGENEPEILEMGPANKCSCAPCVDIRRFSRNWTYWVPTNPLQVSMRNAINRAISDQMLDV